MPDSLFECANPKCGYAIASDQLNRVQLEALRRWTKICPHCRQRTKWQEKIPLLNTEIKSKINGGSKNAKRRKQNQVFDH